MTLLVTLLSWLAALLALCGVAYAIAAAALAKPRRPSTGPARFEPVTLLKPLHMSEPGLAESLRGFFEQDYPEPVQIVFGVRDPNDPAIDVVKSVLREFPGFDAELVVDPSQHGANRKVSNLINMLPHAKHDLLVLSDSDIRVGRDYLRRVMETLERPGVGAVTALYTGQALGGFWARLAAMNVSYQFLPNVLVGTALDMARPCFGSTIALRRAALDAIGGFAAFANQLADDYEIGYAVRRQGLKVAIAPMAVAHLCLERSLPAVISHELRWARTIALIDRPGHLGSLVTHAIPWALIALALSPTALSLTVLTAALTARSLVKLRIDRAFGADSGPLWLVPVRDMLSFGVFLASFFGSSVEWRGTGFRVAPDGVLSERRGE